MNTVMRRQIDERLRQQMSQSMRRAYHAHQRGDLLRRARYALEFVEQEWARKREDMEKEFDEAHPGLR